MVDLRPVDYLGGLGGLDNLPNPARDQAQALALRTTQLQQQAAQLQLQKAREAQQRQQQFYGDIAALGNNPTPMGIAGMIRKYPEFADQLKQAHDIQDEAKRNSDLRIQSEIYSAAAVGKYELAADLLEKYHDAAVRAGEPPDETDQAIIAALRSGDPAEQKRALLMTGLQVAVVNPKKFDETIRALDLNAGAKNVVVAEGSSIVNPDTGQVIFQAPRKPELRNVGPGETIVQIGGDTSGGTPSGNSPEAALSTRLNNPGAIRFDPANNWQGQVGQENGFVKFDSVASGRRAHQKLIANQIKAGFDTPLTWAQRYAPEEDGNDPAAYARTVANGLGIGVNDKIPLSAVPKMAQISAQVEAGGTPQPQAGGARVVAQGAPKQQEAPSGYRWNSSGALEPIPGGPADPAGAGNRNTTSNRKAEADFRKEFNNLPEVKNFRVVRGQLQQIEQIAKNPNAQNDIAMIFSYMKMLDPTSVVREGEFATAQNAAGVPDRVRNWYNKAIDGERLNPEQRQSMLNSARSLYVSQRSIYNERAKEYRGYATDNGVNPDRVAPMYISPVDRARAAGATAFPKTAAEAAKLKPGTIYMRPDGKVMRR